MFPFKVQRGAVRRELGAPQAAPGLPKAGGAAGKEGGRRQARSRRRRRRPPARQEEAEEGWGRRARPPPQDAATMDGGPDPSGLGRAAAIGGQAELGKPWSRRVAISHQAPPTPPAAPPCWVPGCARRRSSPPWRQWRAAERRRGPRPLPLTPPPAGLTPSRPLRRPAADALEAPTHTAPAGQWPEAWGITNCSNAFYKASTLKSLKVANNYGGTT